MSRVEDVAALLRGETKPEVDNERKPEAAPGADEGAESKQPGHSDQEEQKKQERQTVRTLSEKLGITPADVYDLIDIGLPNDKVYSLGQLKDLAVENLAATKTKAQLERDATDLLVQRRELQMVAERAASTGRISQAEVDALREIEEKRLTAEMQNFRRSVPSWDDPVTRSREIDAITAFSKRYGISIPEFEALVTDARLMKLVRDAAVAVPDAGPVVQPRRVPAARPLSGGSTKRDKISAVAQLLRG